MNATPPRLSRSRALRGPWPALVALAAACVADPPQERPASEHDPASDPAKGEVFLPCEGEWRANLLLDNGDTGIWTVKSFPLFEPYATPEVIGLDDAGRCIVLISYSGKWTPLPRVHDGAWLGGIAYGDVDPRIEGAELYVGGKKGNLYRLQAYRHGALDSRLIAHLPGREIHTIVAGELDPSLAGNELLLFTRPGALYRVSATGEHGRYETELVAELPARVRDAVLLPAKGGAPARVVTAARDGRLRCLTMVGGRPVQETWHAEAMGMGRIALRPPELGDELVLYVTLDDGRLLRHERSATGVTTRVVDIGPQGLRGVVAGRFHADPRVESVALFGYAGRVRLLSLVDGTWTSETLFEDRDRGHWLARAELDGRNGTDELLLSGYGGRIVMLSRPPGYGHTDGSTHVAGSTNTASALPKEKTP